MSQNASLSWLSLAAEFSVHNEYSMTSLLSRRALISPEKPQPVGIRRSFYTQGHRGLQMLKSPQIHMRCLLRGRLKFHLTLWPIVSAHHATSPWEDPGDSGSFLFWSQCVRLHSFQMSQVNMAGFALSFNRCPSHFSWRQRPSPRSPKPTTVTISLN